MTMRKLQTNFTSGEIDESLEGRTDLPLYGNGLGRLRNMRPLAGGGATRRAGFAQVAAIDLGVYQHVEWIFNTAQTYQLLFSMGEVAIHDGVTGAWIDNQMGPWGEDMIGFLSVYCQGDYAFVAHPDMPPHQIRRTSAVTFQVEAFAFDRMTSGEEAPIFQPYHRYIPADRPIRVNANTGYTIATGWLPGATCDLFTNGGSGWDGYDFFTSDYIGSILEISGSQFEILTIVSARQATARLRSRDFRIHLTENPMTINDPGPRVLVYDPFHDFALAAGVSIHDAIPFSNAAYSQLNGPKSVAYIDDSSWGFDMVSPPAYFAGTGGGPDVSYWSGIVTTVDWKEQMYSAARGWPHCVSGFQSRLILGGGRDAPNRLNLSRVEAPFNFDPGTGLDNEAILVGLTGPRTPTVLSVIGGPHVQIFTSEGEFFIPQVEDQAALTPTTVAVRPQTFYGIERGVPAVDFDGATLFVSKNGRHLRQLVFSEGSYSAPDLSFVSHHLLTEPKWLAVQMEDADQAAASAFIVNEDGTLAILTMMRSEKIAAWGAYNTMGHIQSACAVDNRAFFIVDRTIDGVPVCWLEKADATRLLDGSVMGTFVAPAGQEFVWGGFEIYAGHTINIVMDGRSDIGPFEVSVDGKVTLPVTATTVEGGLPFAPLVRTLPPELVLQDGPTVGEPRRVVTAMVNLKNSLGVSVRNNWLLNTRGDSDLSVAAPLFSGRVHVPLLGWDDTGTVEISQHSNSPFTILSVNLDLEF